MRRLSHLFGILGVLVWILSLIYEAGPGSSGSPPEGFELILYIGMVLIGGAVSYGIGWGIIQLIAWVQAGFQEDRQ
jgi:hypothetical protein